VSSLHLTRNVLKYHYVSLEFFLFKFEATCYLGLKSDTKNAIFLFLSLLIAFVKIIESQGIQVVFGG
jgi:hypothetical protein